MLPPNPYDEGASQAPSTFPETAPVTEPLSEKKETGYPWLFFYAGTSWLKGLGLTLVVTGLGGISYVWYSEATHDTSPFSTPGLIYATLGTIFFVLAAVSYALRRRLRKRAVGQLHASLNWHVFFALMSLVMIFLHSFGNFEPISGTFALYGLIAMTISGFIGRLLDRVLPRLIAVEVQKVLTEQGDDRIANISQKLEAIVVHQTQKELHGFKVGKRDTEPTPVPAKRSSPNSMSFIGDMLHKPWDLAYISLEPTQQELDRQGTHYRFIPDKKSALNRPEALLPGAEEQMSELQEMHTAMQREQFYRYIIRLWRVFHICLALVTIGLVTWHLIFATTILLRIYAD